MKTTRNPALRVTVLGSGTSSGVPLIGCRCAVCRSRAPKNRRLRASIWVQARPEPTGQVSSLLIDTSTDLRAQALRHRIDRVDAVLYTHPHADHVSGVDELRAWNFLQRQVIPAFGNAWTLAELPARYPYIFAPARTAPEGGGIPQVKLSLIPELEPEFEPIPGVRVGLLPVWHGSQKTLGFRFGSFAYVTDCSQIPESTFARMESLSTLILDCVRLEPHRTHFHFDAALDVIKRLRPRRTYLTHLGHDFDHTTWQRRLKRLGLGPSVQVELAFDGLTIQHRAYA